MPELVNHGHCKNCGRAVKSGQDLCSDACQKEWTAFQKKRSRTVIFFYVVGAFLLLILIVQLTGVWGV